MSTKNHEITVNNVKFDSLSSASKYFHVPLTEIMERLNAGMTPEEAVGVPKKLNMNEPVRQTPKNKEATIDEKNASTQFASKAVTLGNETFSSIAAFSRHYDLNPEKVRARLYRGQSPQSIIDTLGGRASKPISVITSSKKIKGVKVSSTKKSNKFKVDGMAFGSVKELSEHYHTNEDIIKERLLQGWSVAQAVGVETHPSQKLTATAPKNLVVNGKHFHSVVDIANFMHVDIDALVSLLGTGLSCEESVAKLRSVSVGGKTFSSEREAAQTVGVALSTFYQRRKRGMSIEEALGKKLKNGTDKAQPISFNGKTYDSLRDMATSLGLSSHKIRYRIRKLSMSINEAVESLIEPAQTVQKEVPETATRPSAKIIQFRGKTYASISAFAVAYGQKPNTVITRLNKGWSRAESVLVAKRKAGSKNISTPLANVKTKGSMTKNIRFKGEVYPSIESFADVIGVTPEKVESQLKEGISITQIANARPTVVKASTLKQPKHTKGERDLVIVKNIMPVQIEGMTFNTAAELARHYNMNAPRVTGRLKNGWSPEQAVELDVQNKKPRVMSNTHLKIGSKTFANIKALALHYNLSYRKVQYRLNQGATTEQAVLLKPWTAPQHKGKEVELDGVVYSSYKNLADEFSVDYNLMMGRIHAGWMLSDAVKGKVKGGSQSKTKAKRIKVRGRTPNKSLANNEPQKQNLSNLLPNIDRAVMLGNLRFVNVTDFAEHLALDPAVTERRLSSGWSPHQIAGLAPPPNWQY